MKILITFLIFITPTLNAETCLYSLDEKNFSMKWTAFKEPKKIGVPGTFNDFKITSKEDENIDAVLKNATFEIKTDTINTKDKARDNTIFRFFFKNMAKNTLITGLVKKVEKENILMDLTFNGATKEVSLSKQIDNNKNELKLSGTINVLNFGMDELLKSLTKACGALHKGVTWPDVEIELNATFKKTCK